jgi:xanthosine utilization system XapX-like protein
VTFTPAARPAPPARPKWLTLAAAGVIVIAVFAILGGLSSLGGLVFSRFHPFASMAGSAPELAKMVALQQKLMSGPAPAASLVVGIAGMAVGAWAIHAATGVLGSKPAARMAFRRAVALLGAIELAHLALGVWLQIEAYQLFGSFADTMFGRGPTTASPNDFAGTVQTVMQGFVIFGVVFAVGLGLLKLGFLAWSYRHASTRDVVAYLDRQT